MSELYAGFLALEAELRAQELQKLALEMQERQAWHRALAHPELAGEIVDSTSRRRSWRRVARRAA